MKDKLPLQLKVSVLTPTHAHAMTPPVQMFTSAILALRLARLMLIAPMKQIIVTPPTVFAPTALVMSAQPPLLPALNAQPPVLQPVFAQLMTLALPPTQLLMSAPSDPTATLQTHALPTALKLLTAQSKIRFAKL